VTDWTDKAIDFMVIYDEEKALWQIGKMNDKRYVVVRHDPLPLAKLVEVTGRVA